MTARRIVVPNIEFFAPAREISEVSRCIEYLSHSSNPILREARGLITEPQKAGPLRVACHTILTRAVEQSLAGNLSASRFEAQNSLALSLGAGFYDLSFASIDLQMTTAELQKDFGTTSCLAWLRQQLIPLSSTENPSLLQALLVAIRAAQTGIDGSQAARKRFSGIPFGFLAAPHLINDSADWTALEMFHAAYQSYIYGHLSLGNFSVVRRTMACIQEVSLADFSHCFKGTTTRALSWYEPEADEPCPSSHLRFSVLANQGNEPLVIILDTPRGSYWGEAPVTTNLTNSWLMILRAPLELLGPLPGITTAKTKGEYVDELSRLASELLLSTEMRPGKQPPSFGEAWPEPSETLFSLLQSYKEPEIAVAALNRAAFLPYELLLAKPEGRCSPHVSLTFGIRPPNPGPRLESRDRILVVADRSLPFSELQAVLAIGLVPSHLRTIVLLEGANAFVCHDGIFRELDATPDLFESLFSSHKVIALACHGPEWSSNKPNEQTILKVDLGDTHLALIKAENLFRSPPAPGSLVLSHSCISASSSFLNGETSATVFGSLATANPEISMVGALWDIDDISACLYGHTLLTQLYQHRLCLQDALRQTKKALRENQKPSVEVLEQALREGWPPVLENEPTLRLLFSHCIGASTSEPYCWSSHVALSMAVESHGARPEGTNWRA